MLVFEQITKINTSVNDDRYDGERAERETKELGDKVEKGKRGHEER